MIFSFLSLGVIPALRLTNRGLVDGVDVRARLAARVSIGLGRRR